MQIPICPKCKVQMESKKLSRTIPYKGTEVDISEDAFICPLCKLSTGPVQTAGKIQDQLLTVYDEMKIGPK